MVEHFLNASAIAAFISKSKQIGSPALVRTCNSFPPNLFYDLRWSINKLYAFSNFGYIQIGKGKLSHHHNVVTKKHFFNWGQHSPRKISLPCRHFIPTTNHVLDLNIRKFFYTIPKILPMSLQ